MSDADIAIEIEDNTNGHLRAELAPDDRDWLNQALRRREPESGLVALRISDEGDDTEGHIANLVRVRAAFDVDDTEGHAISLHFPTGQEADAFRRRLLATGLIVGTVALGAAASAAISSAQIGSPSAGPAVVDTGAGAPTYVDAARNQALQDVSGRAPSYVDAARNQALQDAAAQQGTTGAPSYVDAARNEALQDAAVPQVTDTGAPSYVDAARNQAVQNAAEDEQSEPPALKGPGPR